MNFWTTIGLAVVFLALYRFWCEYKKSEKISKNSLFLGFIAIVLLFGAVDKLTTNLLYNYLGRIYYNRFIGMLIDALIIGGAFRRTKKELSTKELIIDRLSFLYCIVFFTWYFMYYLCK